LNSNLDFAGCPSQYLSDCHFEFDDGVDRKVYAHKIVLAARSDILQMHSEGSAKTEHEENSFRKSHRGRNEESDDSDDSDDDMVPDVLKRLQKVQQKGMKIRTFSRRVFIALLCFLYTGELCDEAKAAETAHDAASANARRRRLTQGDQGFDEGDDLELFAQPVSPLVVLVLELLLPLLRAALMYRVQTLGAWVLRLLRQRLDPSSVMLVLAVVTSAPEDKDDAEAEVSTAAARARTSILASKAKASERLAKGAAPSHEQLKEWCLLPACRARDTGEDTVTEDTVTEGTEDGQRTKQCTPPPNTPAGVLLGQCQRLLLSLPLFSPDDETEYQQRHAASSDHSSDHPPCDFVRVISGVAAVDAAGVGSAAHLVSSGCSAEVLLEMIERKLAWDMRAKEGVREWVAEEEAAQGVAEGAMMAAAILVLAITTRRLDVVQAALNHGNEGTLRENEDDEGFVQTTRYPCKRLSMLQPNWQQECALEAAVRCSCRSHSGSKGSGKGASMADASEIRSMSILKLVLEKATPVELGGQLHPLDPFVSSTDADTLKMEEDGDEGDDGRKGRRQKQVRVKSKKKQWKSAEEGGSPLSAKGTILHFAVSTSTSSTSSNDSSNGSSNDSSGSKVNTSSSGGSDAVDDQSASLVPVLRALLDAGQEHIDARDSKVLGHHNSPHPPCLLVA
jgi:hypothetical protein